MAVKQSKKVFTADEIMGINLGLGWLLGVDVKTAGVDVVMDAVSATNEIKSPIKEIRTVSEKLHKDFFIEKTASGDSKVPENLLEDYENAEKALASKEFELTLPVFDMKKLEKLPGLTGKTILQLQPILKK